tara:strand:- start:278 stop:472 length:195 start_codon:yes stop_codon:yes gene_type:complete
MPDLKKTSQDNENFSQGVIDWWIKWVRIHNKKVISEEEAKSELDQLQSFITNLKNLYDDKSPKK